LQGKKSTKGPKPCKKYYLKEQNMKPKNSESKELQLMPIHLICKSYQVHFRHAFFILA